MSEQTYFFSLWLKRTPSEIENYLFAYRKELSRNNDLDIFALNALLALSED